MAVAKVVPGEPVIDEGEELEDTLHGEGGVGLHAGGLPQGSVDEQFRAPAHLHGPTLGASDGKAALFGQGR